MSLQIIKAADGGADHIIQFIAADSTAPPTAVARNSKRGTARQEGAAVSSKAPCETVILLHPLLPSVGVSIGMDWGMSAKRLSRQGLLVGRADAGASQRSVGGEFFCCCVPTMGELINDIEQAVQAAAAGETAAFCSRAPPSPFSRRCDRGGEGMPAK